MIGRPMVAGLAAVLVLGGLFSQRSPDPRVADPGGLATLEAATLHDRQAAADALRAVARALDAAIADARDGAALTVQIGGQPGPHLSSAAAAFTAAEPLADSARRALDRLAGDLVILGRTPPLALDVAPGDLRSIGAQLDSSGAAADGFWSMHRATQATLDSLGGALAALAARDASAALADLDRADASLAEVRAWPGKLDTLPIWIGTTSDLLAAVRALARATRDHDLAAARVAEKAYEAAADDAHRADLALAIAVAEGGDAVNAAALSAAANALRSVDAAVAAVDAIEIAASILA